MTAPAWLEVLNETLDACRTHGRADLAERLRRRRDAPEGQIRLGVLGFPKQGKGYLLNAVLNAPVCAQTSFSRSYRSSVPLQMIFRIAIVLSNR